MFSNFCHILSTYIKNVEETNKSKVVEYEFKTKEILDNGTFYTRSCKYKLANGIVRKLSRLEDSYLMDFYGTPTYVVRPSCSDCEFKRPERQGDITIGDAWKINELYPEVIPTMGVSALIINSDKGMSLGPLIKKYMNVYDMDYEFMQRNNEPLRRK